MKTLFALVITLLACASAEAETATRNATHELLQQKWRTLWFRWELDGGDHYAKGTSILFQRKDAQNVIVSTFTGENPGKNAVVLSTISADSATAIVSELITFVDRAQKQAENKARSESKASESPQSQAGFGTPEGFLRVQIVSEVAGITSDLLGRFGSDLDAFNSFSVFVERLIKNRGQMKPEH